MRSLLEWVVVIVLLAAVVRLAGGWVDRWLPRAAAPATDMVEALTPPGVPATAVSVPLLVLIDGTELRLGLSESALRELVSDRLSAAPRVASRGAFGDRITRAYLAQGTRFWVVIERPQPGDEMQVTGIFVQ